MTAYKESLDLMELPNGLKKVLLVGKNAYAAHVFRSEYPDVEITLLNHEDKVEKKHNKTRYDNIIRCDVAHYNWFRDMDGDIYDLVLITDIVDTLDVKTAKEIFRKAKNIAHNVMFISGVLDEDQIIASFDGVKYIKTVGSRVYAIFPGCPHLPSVMICLPNLGNLATELCAVMMNIQAQAIEQGRKVYISYSNAKPVAYNRQFMAEKFLESDFEWMLSIDADVVPPANILSIINPERKLIAAHCNMCKNGEVLPVAFHKGIDGRYLHPLIEFGDVLEVDAFGTGCYAAHRSVFEALEPPFYQENYSFKTGKVVKTQGEDVYFVEKAKAAGFQPYYDANFVCSHKVVRAI